MTAFLLRFKLMNKSLGFGSVPALIWCKILVTGFAACCLIFQTEHRGKVTEDNYLSSVIHSICV